MKSDAKKTITINVDEGFLPKFSAAFLKHYGGHSIFVRTLSDHFTTRLVQMMEAKGKLPHPEKVATFSTPQALERLETWLESVEGAHKMALQESMGSLPVGSLESLVDGTLGKGRFAEWLDWMKE